MDTQCRKAYVSVNVDVDEEGTMPSLHPLEENWSDLSDRPNLV